MIFEAGEGRLSSYRARVWILLPLLRESVQTLHEAQLDAEDSVRGEEIGEEEEEEKGNDDDDDDDDDDYEEEEEEDYGLEGVWRGEEREDDDYRRVSLDFRVVSETSGGHDPSFRK